MIKYDNLFLAVLEKVVPIFLMLILAFGLLIYSSISYLILFIYIVLLSYFSYWFYQMKYILFPKSKIGNELALLSNEKQLNHKGIIFWAIVTSAIYAKFMINENLIILGVFNSQILNFLSFLLIIITNFVLLFGSMIESSVGVYSEGILLKRFIRWEEIIKYTVEKEKIYIKIKNRTLGLENNYSIPISKEKNSNISEVEKVLEKKINI